MSSSSLLNGVMAYALVLLGMMSGPYSDRLSVSAKRNGIGIDSACTSMTPNHYADGQTSPSPYNISISSQSYTPGSPVTVTISACTADPFKGFLIQARRALIGSDQSEALGSFTAVAGTQQTCSGKGLIHTSNSEKNELIFDWNPPSTPQGPIQFRVTFVKANSTYWIAVTSDVVLYQNQAPQPDSSTLSPSSQFLSNCLYNAPVTSNQKPSGCGSTKACITKCNGLDCDQVISWEESGSFVLYTVTSVVSAPTSFIAIGFSSDKVMGSDSVTGCAASTGTSAVLFNAENTGRKPPALFDDNEVKLVRSSYSNSILSCTFKRPKAASGKRFDVTQKWHIIFATSSATISGQDVVPSYHFQNRFFTSEKYASSDFANEELNTPDPPASGPTGALTVPTECGNTKGCISKCSGSCETVISWEESGNFVLYTLSSVASSSSFLALGMSSDDKMGGDSVIGCAEASDGSVVAFTAENDGRTPKMFDDNEVTLKSHRRDNNILHCTIQRPKAGSGKRFDATKKWIILFARAGATVNGQSVSISYHSGNKFFSSSKYSSSDRPNVGAEEPEYKMIKAHGSLMVAAWVFLAGIGIVAARYYKPVWKTELFSQKVWFQIHRTCMVLVFCATVAGFVIIFVEVEGWSDLIEDEEYLEYHPVLGVIVTSLTVLNPLMALFRPHPGTKNRPYFNWAHWLVGTLAHILGVVTIFFGIQLQKADVPDYMVYILAGYVGWQVLIELVLEVMQCCGKERARQEMYEMDNLQDQKMNTHESQQTLSGKKVLLFIHLFVLSAITAVIIGFIVVGEDDL